MDKITPKIKDATPVAGLRLVMLHASIPDVVTIKGSILGGDVFSPEENPLLASLTADMLDEGTHSHSKNIIREKLESVGASLSFGASQYRVWFNIKCLKKDISLTIRLLAEQLREPAFHEADFSIVQKRAIGLLEQSREETQARASIALSRKLFPKGHPNYSYDADESIEFIKKASVYDLKEFYKKNYGLGEAIIVAVGDFGDEKLAEEIKKGFEGWHMNSLPKSMEFSPASPSIGENKFITLKEKENVDLIYGQALGINREHKDFEPLRLGIRILGGDFSARLNGYVRDKLGLTYGIKAGISGTGSGYDGSFIVKGIFAPALLGRGMLESENQIKIWAKDGITKEELEEKKKTIAGEYIVALETTDGLSGAILGVLERGKPLDYLDEYPNIIQAITLEEVNSAINKYINLGNMTKVAAGSIDAEGKPLAG